jgi:hypothetical protein
MIESIIISTLAADTALAAILTTYEGAPAIFSEEAPENAEEPNVTISLTRANGPDPTIQLFTLNVDYWDYGKSRADSRTAAERIEFVLDRADLEHARYSSIRCFFASGGPLTETNPRAIHYNLQFEVRAFRKKWMEQLDNVATTTTTAGV